MLLSKMVIKNRSLVTKHDNRLQTEAGPCLVGFSWSSSLVMAHLQAGFTGVLTTFLAAQAGRPAKTSYFQLKLLTQNNLLDSNQSGFRSGHLTETALLSVVEALRLARADSKSSILTLLNLSAAFDTVNHKTILSTLLAKGISGTALQWFESYLSDRSIKVSWRGEVSKSQHLITGVAPGLSSWTTSLLCLYGITRLCHSVIHGFLYHCYADDNQLYLSFHPDYPTIAAHISACLTDISCWMKQHRLQLNFPRPNCLWFHQTHSFITIVPSS